MSLVPRFTMARSRMRLARRTVRLRLTLLYSLLFLVAGAGLLVVTYFLVRSATNTMRSPYSTLPSSMVSAPPHKGTPLGLAGLPLAARLKAEALATHAFEMHQLLIWSGVALVLMALVAVVLGWLVAGRVLRPLRAITTATQRITEHNLHERLVLSGPSDEIKDLADTIDGLLSRLETAFDAQHNFVANASHELRTPLALNRALLEVTLRDPAATVSELRTMGQELLTSGEHQAQLLESLLTLATSERGLERHDSIDLSKVTADVLLGPRPEIDELRLEVHTFLAPAPAVGDPRLAERLVANLFENALRHNVPGGHVTIATQAELGRAVLAITNSGPTIPESEIVRLFQPFERLDRDRAHRSSGHGLGLSIVQSIATAHGASLNARPRSRGGLHIEVSFPSPIQAGGSSVRPIENGHR